MFKYVLNFYLHKIYTRTHTIFHKLVVLDACDLYLLMSFFSFHCNLQLKWCFSHTHNLQQYIKMKINTKIFRKKKIEMLFLHTKETKSLSSTSRKKKERNAANIGTLKMSSENCLYLLQIEFSIFFLFLIFSHFKFNIYLLF